MAKKKRVSALKRFTTAGAVLIGLEGLFLIYHFAFDSAEVLSPSEAINRAIENLPAVSDKRKEQARVQLAIADFMAQNGGKPPPRLDELIPKYFDTLPLDPETGQPFPYRIEGTRYYLGTSALKAGGQAKIVTEGGVELSSQEQAALIASLTEEPSQVAFVYNPAGKRDPFAPFDFAPKPADGAGKSPLEKFSLGQLKLTAVLRGFDQPTAIVEDTAGKGYMVNRGSKIGSAGGEIVDILADKLIILESNVDFTGQKKERTIEMPLRTKDQEESGHHGHKKSGPSR